MNKTLDLLCDAIKKILNRLKSQSKPLSFVLLTGIKEEGKTTLLRQSKLHAYAFDSECDINLYYNDHGIILELDDYWINRNENLLANTFKRLNHCHPNSRISGLLFCIDSSHLLSLDPSQLIEHCARYRQLLERIGQALEYRIEAGIIFNKIDALAGFSEFFQSEHQSDLIKPLGFSVQQANNRKQFIEFFNRQFDMMLETLGQQIINKLHPARSSAKRTLIREFPLQLSSLRIPIQTILSQVSPKLFHLQAIYFTSAEQGGISIDRLNKKIENEYALVVQDKFPQSNNYRPYFIQGAIFSFQRCTKYHQPRITLQHKSIAVATCSTVGLLLVGLIYHHISASRLLNEANNELIHYELTINKDHASSEALYHLTLAQAKLDAIRTTPMASSVIGQLRNQLQNGTHQQMHDNFLPHIISQLETVMLNASESQFERYQALKIYLMLGDSTHYSEIEVINWFKNYWQKNNPTVSNQRDVLLLKQALKQPVQSINIDQQIVRDMRNYFNALPMTYLYYALAKKNFPTEQHPISIAGFNLAAREIPAHLTKAGFNQIMDRLPKISDQLTRENWVLKRQDIKNLHEQLQEAYTTEYTRWWQNFISNTHPQHYQGYKEARALTQTIEQHHSISALIQLIQQETTPDAGNYHKIFNNRIAHQFTGINLLTTTAVNELNQTMAELDKFLSTIALVHDQGRTVFELTKSRFINGNAVDPLSMLYTRARQLPAPVSEWTKQIADDTWVMFISNSKQYLNQQWQKQVYGDYQNYISNRFPFDTQAHEEINIADFNRFFNPNGVLTHFANENIRPFLDTTNPQWKPKELDGYVIPISESLIDELIRANVITKMFFPNNNISSRVEFSLQKIELDPIVSHLKLMIGNITLDDNQSSDSDVYFNWPSFDAKLSLTSIDGNHYELDEAGPWAFFKMLQKVNVMVDNDDSSSLQILFEVNGNSGRYLLKKQNQINPFSPGILAGFNLNEDLA